MDVSILLLLLVLIVPLVVIVFFGLFQVLPYMIEGHGLFS